MPTENAEFVLFRDFPEPVFVMDPRGTILDRNNAFVCQLLNGVPESPNLNAYELLASGNPENALSERLRSLAGEVLRTGTHRALEGGLHGRRSSICLYPAPPDERGGRRLLGILRESSGTQRQTLAGTEGNTLFRELLDAVPQALFILDDEALLVGCNDYAFELFGNRNREIPDNDLAGLLHPDDRDRIVERLLEAMDSGRTEADEARLYLHGDRGLAKWFELRSRRKEISGQAYLVVAGVDIHDRKLACERAAVYGRWLNTAMEAADSGVWEWDVETSGLAWSDRIWSLYGLEFGCGTTPTFDLWTGTIHPDDREMAVTALRNAARQRASINIEYRILRPDGTIRWIMACGKPVTDGCGEALRYGGTAIDITEQKQIESELHRSRAHLDFALEKSHIGWWEMNLFDHSVLRTMEIARIFGYDSLLSGWSFEQFLGHVAPEERPRIRELVFSSIEKRRDYAFECRIIGANSDTRWIWSSGTLRFDSDGSATHLLGIVQDITERKRGDAEHEQLQAHFQQSQKMELVGQLAGGIAHDFNNALTAILGNIELLKRKLDRSTPLAGHINDIEKSAERSANLTRQLLAFARKETALPKELFLNQEVEKLLPMLRGLIGNHIRFVWKPNAQEQRILIDPSQLDQVIVNLCINSRDAIGHSGVITIETGIEQVASSDCATGHTCLVPGVYVRIMVSDTGSGIDPKTLPHIFEPFFTTKEIGKGTGLGLSTVYGVLKQNRGFIECRTELQRGTTFAVYLPRHDAPSGSSREAVPDDSPTHAAGGAILLVEDEPAILTMLGDLLKYRGFTVLSTQDAQSALDMAAHHPDGIELLITDIVLPDMNGVWLSNRLQEEHPNLKTLFMSGYAPDLAAYGDKLDEGINFIQKPFSISAFMSMVGQMLPRHLEAQPRRSRTGSA